MIKSPCIGKCTYDITIMKCNDCGRTKEEISTWYVMTEDEKLTVLERLMNDNEPVAWMRENEVWEGKYNFSKEKPPAYPNAIPLYTHPVKEQDVKYNVTVRWDDKITYHKNVSVDTPLHYTHPVKELTDEEIAEVIDTLWNRGIGGHDKEWLFKIYNFARAILRKAQEK